MSCSSNVRVAMSVYSIDMKPRVCKTLYSRSLPTLTTRSLSTEQSPSSSHMLYNALDWVLDFQIRFVKVHDDL